MHGNSKKKPPLGGFFLLYEIYQSVHSCAFQYTLKAGRPGEPISHDLPSLLTDMEGGRMRTIRPLGYVAHDDEDIWEQKKLVTEAGNNNVRFAELREDRNLCTSSVMVPGVE